MPRVKFNEFNVWLWADAEDRFMNPATDASLFQAGPAGPLPGAPKWSDIRDAGLIFVMLLAPLFKCASAEGAHLEGLIKSVQVYIHIYIYIYTCIYMYVYIRHNKVL